MAGQLFELMFLFCDESVQGYGSGDMWPTNRFVMLSIVDRFRYCTSDNI